MEDSSPLTWTLLTKLEPGLGQLHLDCRFADKRDPSGFDREAAWNGTPNAAGLKSRLDQLVGKGARNHDARIISKEAFDLASSECFSALPPNRLGNR